MIFNQAESERIALEQMALLDEAKQRIVLNHPLSRLEQSGVLHALQVLIENAIGKSKHWLKSLNQAVPVSAYDAFACLECSGIIAEKELEQWNAAIGLHNRIAHDYINVDIQFIYDLIVNNRHQLLVNFYVNQLRRKLIARSLSENTILKILTTIYSVLIIENTTYR